MQLVTLVREKSVWMARSDFVISPLRRTSSISVFSAIVTDRVDWLKPRPAPAMQAGALATPDLGPFWVSPRAIPITGCDPRSCRGAGRRGA